MPWKIVRRNDGYWVVKESTGRPVHKKPYATKKKALAYLRALYASERRKK